MIVLKSLITIGIFLYLSSANLSYAEDYTNQVYDFRMYLKGCAKISSKDVTITKVYKMSPEYDAEEKTAELEFKIPDGLNRKWCILVEKKPEKEKYAQPMYDANIVLEDWYDGKTEKFSWIRIRFRWPAREESSIDASLRRLAEMAFEEAQNANVIDQSYFREINGMKAFEMKYTIAGGWMEDVFSVLLKGYCYEVILMTNQNNLAAERDDLLKIMATFE